MLSMLCSPVSVLMFALQVLAPLRP